MRRVSWIFFLIVTTGACSAADVKTVGHYMIRGDNIYDSREDLTWMRQTADVDNNRKIDANDILEWEEAVGYCENLTFSGYDDWRLPSLRELKNLVAEDTYDPSISPVFSCRSAYYWSVTTHKNDEDYAWYVYFNQGKAGWGDKLYEYHVRCVRNGS